MDDIAARVGRTFTVRLSSNPSTGYAWHLTPDEHVDVVDETFESSAAEGMVGSGGTQVFTLRARQVGRTTLTFVHRRAWERDLPPLQVETVAVRVRR